MAETSETARDCASPAPVCLGFALFDVDDRLILWNDRFCAMLDDVRSGLARGMSFTDYLGLTARSRSVVLPEGMAPDAWVRARLEQCLLQTRSFGLSLKGGADVHLDEFRLGDGTTMVLHSAAGRTEPPDGGSGSFEAAAMAELHAARAQCETRLRAPAADLKAALEGVRAAETACARMVASVSHDLLQPLSAAKLFLAAIRDEDMSGANRATLSQVRSAFVSVEYLLASLLDISRAETGRMGTQMRAFPISELFGPLKKEFGVIAQQRGLGFRVVDSSVVVRSDALYLRRIVQNLLSNAIRYTPSGKVLMGVRRCGEAVRIEICDTGVGIAESDRDLAFSAFGRLRKVNVSEEGVGLGLAIVKRACDLLGHELELLSSEGRGTHVRLILPRAAEQEGETGGRPEISQRQASDTVVVLIEDDEQVRQAMGDLLRDWGATVIEARGTTGALAALAAAQTDPGLVLADFHLSGSDSGLLAISAIQRKYGRVPAALVAASRSDGLVRYCRNNDIAYLSKPPDPVQLRQVLVQAAGEVDYP